MSEPKTLRPGRARSIKETRAYVGSATCPDCGRSLLAQWSERAPDGADHVYHTRAVCPGCGASWDLLFERGPGWDAQPDDDDVRFAIGSEPSTLLGEERFRAVVDHATKRLRMLGERPTATAASKRERAEWDENVYMLARDAIGAALELEKLGRGGKELDEQKRFFVERYRSVGGELPPGVAEIK